MGKPHVFICFDTEDPINPEADDALLRLARLYEKAGIQACYFMVGEKPGCFESGDERTC